jgi:hypothetical protein
MFLCFRFALVLSLARYRSHPKIFTLLGTWYVANISIIFDAPCLFYTNCFMFCLHFVAFLCIFRN